MSNYSDTRYNNTTNNFFHVKAIRQNSSVLERIKNGLKYATNYLERARDIADLVSKSLNQKQSQKRGEDGDDKKQSRPNFGTRSVITAFFALLGLDSQKITAIAVNSVIFLAQLISSLFDLKSPIVTEARNAETNEPLWDPMRFIVENKNERIQRLVEQAQNENLPNQLMDRLDGFDSTCIKLLLCKTTPVIWAAQKSLKNRTQAASRRLTSWLPSREAFEENSDRCEEKHTDCKLFPES
ncbi:uncharacterized protein [Prorops nasuta]|uniref:uncharacterized protein n=1 Tax=Prorops nasuta TaxID=863751 RepID=UPI0034CEBDD0